MTDPHHAVDDHGLTETGDIHAPVRPSDHFVRRARLQKVIDGDTLRLVIDLGWATRITEDVRLAGLNTPEHRGSERLAGQWVTGQVRLWLHEAERNLLIHSRKFAVGKYGRCLCDVWSSRGNLNTWILSSGFAWPTDGNGSTIGPRDIDRLTGIPDDIRQQVRLSA